VLEVYAVDRLKERLKSQILMKRNIKFLLHHRGKSQAALARHLRRQGMDDKTADSWLSHYLNERSERELPFEYWDRAADFLGVDTYHFFIPGLGENFETERRSGRDRRSWVERRQGNSLPERPRDLDLMLIIRAIPAEDLDEAADGLVKILDRALKRRRARLTSAGGQGRKDGTREASHAQGPSKGKTQA